MNKYSLSALTVCVALGAAAEKPITVTLKPADESPIIQKEINDKFNENKATSNSEYKPQLTLPPKR
ncbi:MAG: hypothetical protein K2N16_00560, partial [Muribaculaceae bacterium]|nr:hypothetical protein [Muribaculaceae bacterium]